MEGEIEMIEGKILKKLEDAEHNVWDAYVAMKKSRSNKYFDGVERAWVELTIIVERMRKEYRKSHGLKEG